MVEADLSADHDEDQVGTLEHAIHCRKTSHLENPASFPLLLGGLSFMSNAWMERCKSLVKNFERTLANATAKVNLCFIRLMLKRLAMG